MDILSTVYELMQERQNPTLQALFHKTYDNLEPTTENDTQAQDYLFHVLSDLATANHKAGFMQGFRTALELFTGCTPHAQGCPLLHNDLKALIVPKWLITDNGLPDALKILYLRLVVCYGTKQPIQDTFSNIKEEMNIIESTETVRVWLKRMADAKYITLENINAIKGIYKIELLKTI